MKAISIRQPWASAIVLGLKHYETRTWSTRYRGPLLIHAAAGWTRRDVGLQSMLVHMLRMAYGVDDPRVLEFEENPPLGAVIGFCDLVDCRPAESISLPPDDAFHDDDVAGSVEKLLGDFAPGRYAWVLANMARIIPSIPIKGQQGLWEANSIVIDAATDGIQRNRERIAKRKNRGAAT